MEYDENYKPTTHCNLSSPSGKISQSPKYTLGHMVTWVNLTLHSIKSFIVNRVTP